MTGESGESGDPVSAGAASSGNAAIGVGRGSGDTVLALRGGGHRAGGPGRQALLPERLQRRGGGGCLGGPARRATPDAQRSPVHEHLDPELLLVVGPHSLEQAVHRAVARRALRVLLQTALGALERGDRRVGGQLRLGRRTGSSRAPPPSQDRCRWRRQAPRRRMPGATAGPSRPAAPHPRRAAGRNPGRGAQRGAPDLGC